MYSLFKFPKHYTLSKKLTLLKQLPLGRFWDAFLVFVSIIACCFYIANTYVATYDAVQIYRLAETIYTQLFLVDFVYNFFAAQNTVVFMTSGWTIVDLLTIVPYYLALGLSTRVNLSVFRVVRILRLVRILRAFRLLAGLSGVQRQIITLSLTLLSLVFMAAGVIQIMENDVKQQLEYKCLYINAATNWQPSCSLTMPAHSVAGCDCVLRNCHATYGSQDQRGEPSSVSCIRLTFLDCFYFMVVTVATVGYGDIAPTTILSKATVIIYITVSLVVIPMQVNQLVHILSTISVYRQPYIQQNTSDSHIIICGHVSDWRRLERFFREFFHPDRSKLSTPDYHVVILSPLEPSEDIKQLMMLPSVDGNITYLIGSALAIEDLQRARADIATAMIFFCNVEVSSESSKLDDAATILRSLAVSNFNPDLRCIVQVLKREERDTLKDSDIDVILCMDEFRTTLQARNAACPGMAAFIENLFHTFGKAEGSGLEGYNDRDKPWMTEYSNGAGTEAFYVIIPQKYAEALAFNWTLMAEGLYLEFNVMVIGFCNMDRKDIIINPSRLEIREHRDDMSFYKEYPIAIMLVDDESQAHIITMALESDATIERIFEKLLNAEAQLPVRVESGRKDEGDDDIVFNSKGKLRTGSWDLSASSEDRDLRERRDKISGLIDVAMKRSREVWSSFKVMYDEGWDRFSSFDGSLPSSAARSRKSFGFFASGSSKGIGGKGYATQSRIIPTIFDVESGPKSVEGVHNLKRSPRDNRREKSDTKFELGLAALANVECQFGPPSGVLQSSGDISNHVIVFGCMTNLMVFVSELRSPLLLNKASFHPIIVMNESKPTDWDAIAEKYKSVYFIQGKIENDEYLSRVNPQKAFSVIMLATRDSVLKVEAENLDTDPLFGYLKLKKRIPDHVFFSVEMTCVTNMQVLDSSVIRMFHNHGMLGVDDACDQFEDDTKVTKLHGRFTTQLISTKGSDWTTENLPISSANSQRNLLQQRSSSSQLTSRNPRVTSSRMLQGQGSSRKKLESQQSSNLSAAAQSSNIGASEKKSASKRRLQSQFFFTIFETHHVYPMFASGRAVVPESFDSMLSQTFYGALAPQLLEKLLCGQTYQTMYSIRLPRQFINRRFQDLYRAFMSRNLMVLALYRAPTKANEAVLPFVTTCPRPEILLDANDNVFVFCNPLQLRNAIMYGFSPTLQAGKTGVEGESGMPSKDRVDETEMKAPRLAESKKIIRPPPPMDSKTELQTDLTVAPKPDVNVSNQRHQHGPEVLQRPTLPVVDLGVRDGATNVGAATSSVAGGTAMRAEIPSHGVSVRGGAAATTTAAAVAATTTAAAAAAAAAAAVATPSPLLTSASSVSLFDFNSASELDPIMDS